MAIHLVDKNSRDRSSPTPNVADKLNPGSQGAIGSLSTVFQTPGAQNPARIAFKNNIIISYDENNVPNAIIGFNADLSTTVIKIAQPGINVLTATDSQLVFNSEQDTFKIIDKGSGEIPSFTTNGSGNGSTILEIPHGQTFEPIVDVYVQAQFVNIASSTIVSSSYIPLPILGQTGTNFGYVFFDTDESTIEALNISFGVDETNIYIQAVDKGGNPGQTLAPIPVTYFVRQETGTPSS